MHACLRLAYMYAWTTCGTSVETWDFGLSMCSAVIARIFGHRNALKEPPFCLPKTTFQFPASGKHPGIMPSSRNFPLIFSRMPKMCPDWSSAVEGVISGSIPVGERGRCLPAPAQLQPHPHFPTKSRGNASRVWGIVEWSTMEHGQVQARKTRALWIRYGRLQCVQKRTHVIISDAK